MGRSSIIENKIKFVISSQSPVHEEAGGISAIKIVGKTVHNAGTHHGITHDVFQGNILGRKHTADNTV